MLYNIVQLFNAAPLYLLFKPNKVFCQTRNDARDS